MNAEAAFEIYCEYFAPPGPCGKTIEDVQRLVDKYATLSPRDCAYNVMRPLADYKSGLVSKINRERNGNH